jgi:hypothetical protein
MQLSHIYFSGAKGPLPPYFQKCIQAAKQFFPNFNHVLYDLESARDYLNTKFGAEILGVFDKLRPYAYKSDLLRYCVLYAEGGWYFDAAIRPVMAIDIGDNLETIAFKDMPIISQTTWSCANGVLYSKPWSRVYSHAIELVVKNCRENYYGTNALCPTGPVLLGKAFAIDGENPARLFGDFIHLTPMHANKNASFVLPDGTIFAQAKQAGGGDLSALGALGTNNYNDFYNAKTVYCE